MQDETGQSPVSAPYNGPETQNFTGASPQPTVTFGAAGPQPAPQVFSPMQPATEALPTPQVVSPTQQPVQQVGYPQYSYAVQPAPTSLPAVSQAGVMPAPAKSHKLLLFGIIGGVVFAMLVIVGVVVFALAAASQITASSVQTAQNAANTLTTDIDNISTTSNLLISDTTTSQISTDAKTISDDLADAQKQYNILKNSSAQHNAQVHTAFAAFSAKWPAFASYAQGSTADAQTLLPTFITFENQSEALAQQTPSTNAQLATYLTNYKNLIDAMSQKLSTMHMATTDDTQLLASCQTLLQSSSKDVAQAQSDLSAGQDMSVVEDDLLNVDDAETTFDNTDNTIQTNIDNHIQQIDPSDQLSNVQDALTKLFIQVNK